MAEFWLFGFFEHERIMILSIHFIQGFRDGAIKSADRVPDLILLRLDLLAR